MIYILGVFTGIVLMGIIWFSVNRKPTKYFIRRTVDDKLTYIPVKILYMLESEAPCNERQACIELPDGSREYIGQLRLYKKV